MSYDTQGTYDVPNSNMAMISLVAGILGLTLFPFLGSIVALVTGYMARKEIQESNGNLGGDGMATAGLVMGWIGIGLSAIGLCIGGTVFAISLCLVPLGIMSDSSMIIPPLLMAFLI